jgi:hypothetical protein
MSPQVLSCGDFLLYHHRLQSLIRKKAGFTDSHAVWASLVREKAGNTDNCAVLGYLVREMGVFAESYGVLGSLIRERAGFTVNDDTCYNRFYLVFLKNQIKSIIENGLLVLCVRDFSK